MSAESEPPPQLKYSRYRSVRQAAANKSPPPSNAAKPPEPRNETIQRSRSRYHRPKVTSPPAYDVTSMPTIPQHLPTLQALQGGNEVLPHNHLNQPRSIRPAAVSGENLQQSAGYKDSRTSDLKARGRTEQRINGNQTFNGTQVLSLQRFNESENEAKAQSTGQDEVARLLAEQKRKDLQQLEIELASAPARSSSSPERSPATNKGVEKLGLFIRKRAESKVSPSKSSSSITGPETCPERKSQEASKVKTDEQPRNIIQGGGGAVPGVDAPKSAVNAGERVCL